MSRKPTTHSTDAAARACLDTTRLPPVSAELSPLSLASTRICGRSSRPASQGSTSRLVQATSIAKLARVRSASTLAPPSRGQSLTSTAASSSSPTPPGSPSYAALPASSSLCVRKPRNSRRSLTFPFDSSARQSRAVRMCNTIDEHYCLKGQVMESIHNGMELRYGYALNDPEKNGVVVKIRSKSVSFKNRDDEMAWRSTSEFMLGVPKCQGIAQVLDIFEDSKSYYVIMEKIRGKDLCDAVLAGGGFSLQQTRDALRQLLSGLEELHSRGYIHNDLKLENVMLEIQQKRHSGMRRRAAGLLGTVKLIDFDTVMSFKPNLQPMRVVVGTNQYIAPEAYKGFYSPASDVFSLGVIAYALLTGTFPFHDSIFDTGRTQRNEVGSKHTECIARRLMAAELNWTHDVFEQEPDAKALLSRMLASSDTDRPSVQEVLSHPWLS